jgi:hypothetical protein
VLNLAVDLLVYLAVNSDLGLDALESQGVVAMNSLRKEKFATNPAYRAPAPADYCDEVTDEQMEAVSQLVAREFQGETPEVINGPAW